jgi:protein-S-isoprenylcysteine O-methyltransferase Ste14
MNPATLRTGLSIAWLVFWVGWLGSAGWSKRGTHAVRRRVPVALPLVGLAMFALGLGLATWARFAMGRNWGMPMTLKDEPELVTSGPFRFVRHPIYAGILLALAGTGLASYLYWLFLVAPMAFFFVYCARVEERLMASSFPRAYPSYRARTKMLIPFVL